MDSVAIGFILFIALGMMGAVIVSTRFGLQVQQEREEQQRKAKRLALQLDPLYRQKVEEDRSFLLLQERLQMEREKQAAEIALKRERQAVELRIAAADFDLKQHLETTRVMPETYIVDRELGSVTPLPSLKKAPEEKANPYDQLLQVSPMQPPTEEYLLSQIKENSCTVSPGIRASTGEPVLVDITAVPHGKLIGASGFGKSTCMYIMLHQAAETNSPRRLQLCLLDLEHKTSRLLENYPHVASFRIGRRLVQMVATNADMVAEYLGYLKLELDRRTQLSEAELMRMPVLLIYVEEMLSLQYEVIDPKLLQTIFYSLTILSVRGRKYGMFLYACMQTDYSTDELKVSQKMFRFRGAAAVDVSAARAAGFQNTSLIKHNFQGGKAGQLVIEYPSFSDLVIVPAIELKRLIAQKTGVSENFGGEPGTESVPYIPTLKGERNAIETTLKTDETSREARFQEVRKLRMQEWGKVKIIEKVWNVKAGASKAYKQAEQEYTAIVEQLEGVAG